jgi:predicted permease
VGGVGGLGVAALVNAALGRAIRIGDAGSLHLPVDARILAACFFVSLVAGIGFGLLPAWLASRNDVVATLKQQSRGSTGGRGQRLARHGLIVAEVALALALLAVAGVMIRGFEALLRKDAGWDTGRVLTANIGLPEQSTYDTEDKRRVAIETLERNLARIPGAEQTAICSTPPVFGYSRTGPIQVDGQTPDDPLHQPTAGYFMVGSSFFATLGIPLREGRLFAADLSADSPRVIVVGESLARKFWPHESAVGKRVGAREKGEVVWSEVIGVVRDISFPLNTAHPDTLLQIYKPLVHEPWGFLHVLVRGPAPASFKEEVRRAVADLDRDVAVQNMLTVAEASDRYQHNFRVVNNTLGGFALLGLILAAVGLYGVISNLVAHRTAEFGIRLALGARRADVLALVLGNGVKLTLLGLGLGAGLAYALIRMLGSEMPRMAAADPATLTLVVVVLSSVALFACYWPARRATQVDPVVALRAE